MYRRLGAFVLVVLLAALAFWRLEAVTERQCETSAINRAAIRLLVNDFADQAIRAVQSSDNTLERKAQLVMQFEGYRTERLMGLPPTRDCRKKTYSEIEDEVERGIAAGVL